MNMPLAARAHSRNLLFFSDEDQQDAGEDFDYGEADSLQEEGPLSTPFGIDELAGDSARKQPTWEVPYRDLVGWAREVLPFRFVDKLLGSSPRGPPPPAVTPTLRTARRRARREKHAKSPRGEKSFPRLQDTVAAAVPGLRGYLARTFDKNPWVSAGHGQPVVLPLYHACHGESNGDSDNGDAKRQESRLSNSVKGLRKNSSMLHERRHKAASARCRMAVKQTAQDVDQKSSCKPTVADLPASLESTNGIPQHDDRRGGWHDTFGQRNIREQPVNLWQLTDKLVQRGESFVSEHEASSAAGIRQHASPFFLYVPLVQGHVPYTPARRFVKEAREAIRREAFSSSERTPGRRQLLAKMSSGRKFQMQGQEKIQEHEIAAAQAALEFRFKEEILRDHAAAASPLPTPSPAAPQTLSSYPTVQAAALPRTELVPSCCGDRDTNSSSSVRPLSLSLSKREAAAARLASATSGALAEAAAATSGELARAAAVREGDDVVRRLLEAVERAGLMDDTLTVVTSDHGPPAAAKVRPWWVSKMYRRALVQYDPGSLLVSMLHQQGSFVPSIIFAFLEKGAAGPFRGGKFTTLEGGLRVPCVMHWPRVLGSFALGGLGGVGGVGAAGHPRAQQQQQQQRLFWSDSQGAASGAIVSSLDLFPTFAALALVGPTPCSVPGACSQLEALLSHFPGTSGPRLGHRRS